MSTVDTGEKRIVTPDIKIEGNVVYARVPACFSGHAMTDANGDRWAPVADVIEPESDNPGLRWHNQIMTAILAAKVSAAVLALVAERMEGKRRNTLN